MLALGAALGLMLQPNASPLPHPTVDATTLHKKCCAAIKAGSARPATPARNGTIGIAGGECGILIAAFARSQGRPNHKRDVLLAARSKVP
jgi:hypothetical protein